MPTVALSRDDLFEALGKKYTDEEFEDLCFQFGIELDEITSEQLMRRRELGEKVDVSQYSDEVIYKIDVPANRYDILCLEGLTMALSVFVGKRKTPIFKLSNPKQKLQMAVKPETAQIRPYVVCAVLRNITFTQKSYNSFLDLQDKLHQNICRRRTLVAIGTHDLDSIEGPFTYEALPPHEINFIPLFKEKNFRADELMVEYESDLKLKNYLHIIKDSPVYPVIYDNKRRVLSMPPIINGNHSQIHPKTKNVFIECTATDLEKAKIVLNMMVTMFGEYTQDKFVVEPVDVTYPDGKKHVTPDLSTKKIAANCDYINKAIGIDVKPDQQISFLNKMMLHATHHKKNNELEVSIPPNRPDILHACDVMEDVAVAYGFNNVKFRIPHTNTVGKPNPLNKLTDFLRMEMAYCGYTEVLTLALVSENENFKFLNRPNDGSAVDIANPKTIEFEQCRTSLLPGMLKTLNVNKAAALPLKLFEVSDVILRTTEKDVGAKNERHLIALYTNSTGAGFEVIHGVLDHLMAKLGVKCEKGTGYHIAESKDATLFPGRAADVFFQDKKIGVFGLVHPTVLQSFQLLNPASYLEINVEPFL